MLVRYRMSSKVVTVGPQRPLEEVRRLLKQHRIRQLPVVREHRLVGIVTDRDLRGAPARARVAGDVMTRKPLATTPDTPVDDVARVLRTHKINALPVVEKGKVVGILTAGDVLSAFVELSGAAEPTYRLTLEGCSGARAPLLIRDVIERTRGELKWLHRDQRRATVMHVRLKTKRVEDVVDALEAAGLEVAALVAPPRTRP
ncbi:MAG TPA: CBS domain-containing protein [Candidatus Binatia bacterium]|nr:CBS domain-containing protein [Candidatus Binatia bacterium]